MLLIPSKLRLIVAVFPEILSQSVFTITSRPSRVVLVGELKVILSSTVLCANTEGVFIVAKSMKALIAQVSCFKKVFVFIVFVFIVSLYYTGFFSELLWVVVFLFVEKCKWINSHSRVPGIL